MKLHAIVVTFRRPDDLRIVLDALAAQTRPPDTVTVIDNDLDGSAASVAFGRDDVTYVAPGRNTGPAGGLALGVDRVLTLAPDDDAVVFVDDDDPPVTTTLFEDLLAFRGACPVGPDRLGAVGLAGARYSRRTGMLHRVPDADLVGAVRVQYLGGGQFPIYSCAALRSAGGSRPDLFFGFEELELGLRMEDYGYQLFAAGTLWAQRRAELGRMGTPARQAAAGRARSAWRRYYSVRNLIWITRRHGGVAAAAACTLRSGLGAAARDVVAQRSLRAAGPPLHGVVDAWIGRLGITVRVP